MDKLGGVVFEFLLDSNLGKASYTDENEHREVGSSVPYPNEFKRVYS